MTYLITEIFLCLAIAFFLGLCIGYLMGRAFTCCCKKKASGNSEAKTMPILTLSLMLALFGFTHSAQAEEIQETKASVMQSATAGIIGESGESIGNATFTQGAIGAMMKIEIENLPAGWHGFHIHSVGTCEAHDHFKSASGHIGKSDDKEHGYLNEKGPEKGDLPNIYVHEDGTAKLELFIPQLDIADMMDEDGSSLMIHINPDDHMTQPIGGAGDRIACGVIEKTIDTTQKN